MSNPLVSIITPCYNGENFVGRFLDSILAQTYDNIELIIINDGSTDGTEGILMSYKEKFTEKGYSFIIISQSNSGQSGAINKGLEIFTGDYLTWPDSDDILTPDAIIKKVDFLEKNQEYGTLVCKTLMVDNETLQPLGIQQRVVHSQRDNIFLDLITGTNVYYSPGGYMVRTSMFREAMPTPLQIQAPREIGQNYQLLLPITYQYPTAYIDEVCYLYSIRRGSHSRISHSFNHDIKILKVAQSVLSNIVKNLNVDKSGEEDITKALVIQKVKYLLRVMTKHNRKDFLMDVLNDIERYEINDQEVHRLLLLFKYPMLRLVLRIKNKIMTQLYRKI